MSQDLRGRPLGPVCYPSPTVFVSLGVAERKRRFRQVIDAVEGVDVVWVFAYGSLMWNPAFEPVEQRNAWVADHQRRLCFWTSGSRGTVERPGLGLGLEPGPRGCGGLAQHIRADQLSAQLRDLWTREMRSGVYLARWLRARDAQGNALRALSFVIDPEHPQYVPALDARAMAWIVARARGRHGTCRDYLAGVVDHARRLGAPEDDMERLLQQVDRELAQAGGCAGTPG